jgi:hypothetical protein
MGWSLMAGGSITRDLRGLPDDFIGASFTAGDLRQGWLIGSAPTHILSYNFSADDATGSCADEATDHSFLSGYAYTKDSEPDFFSVQAPGLSFGFVFGTDKLPKVVPYQDVKIDFVQNSLGQLISFKITSNDGTQYMFNSVESVVRQSKLYQGGSELSVLRTTRELYRQPVTYNSQWKLTKVLSPSGGEIILNYRAKALAISKKDHKIWSSATPSSVQNLYFLEDRVTSTYLTSIVSDATEVNISWQGHGEVVRTIAIKDKVYLQEKLFALSYAPISGAAVANTRLFLKGVNEQNSFCLSYPAYRFDYYDVTYGTYNGTTPLPFDNTHEKQDLWGYYNDSATDKKPTVYYYAFKPSEQRYRHYPIGGGVVPTSIFSGSNRTVNPSTVMAGALRKITYPTGGSVTLLYTPNQYHDTETASSQYGPGIRVSQVTISDGIAGAPDIVRTYHYTLASGVSSGKFTSKPAFAFHNGSTLMVAEENLAPDVELLYERVRVDQPGMGYTVFEYDLPHMFGAQAATHVRVARSGVPSCTPLGELKPGPYAFPFVPNTNFEIERGFLRLVTDYNAGGQVVSQKEYTYNWLPKPGHQVWGVKYEKLGNDLFVSGKYLINAGRGKAIQTEVSRVSDMTSPSLQITSSATYTYGASHNLLATVSQLNSDGTNHKIRYKYIPDFTGLSSNATDPYVAGMQARVDLFMHAAPVEVIQSVVSAGSETITGATLTLSKSFATRPLPAQQLSFSGAGGFSEATLSGTGTSQTISRSSYRPRLFFDDYDLQGNLTAWHDVKSKSGGALYGYLGTRPIFSISNASPGQVIFSDFESPNVRDISTGNTTNVQAFSGRYAKVLVSGQTFSQSVQKGKGSRYRYSFKAIGANAGNINLAGAGLPATVISYSSPNEWRSFEGLIDVSQAAASFTLQVTSSANFYLDDFAFYPEAAEVQAQTHDPLYGKSSETNTRNQAAILVYDEIGRLQQLRDQDRVVRQVTNYHYVNGGYAALIPGFSASIESPFAVGSSVTFTASPTCAQAPTYRWFVDNVQVSTNPSFQHTGFTAERKYAIRLEMTDAQLGTGSMQIEVEALNTGTGPIGIVSVVTSDNSYGYTNCDSSVKTFNATLSGDTIESTTHWYYHAGVGNVDEPDSNWTHHSSASSLTFDPKAAWNGVDQSYSILCKVTKGTQVARYVVNITYTPGQYCL